MIKEVIMPKLGETMEEGYLVSWKKEEGEKVKKNEVLFEVMTDKTNFEVEAIDEGYLRKKLFQPSDDPIKVTTVIGYISDTPDEPLPSGSLEKKKENKQEKKVPGSDISVTAKNVIESSDNFVAADKGKVKVSPLARKLAEEARLDISLVKGTGPDGRVEKKDVLEYIDKKNLAGTSSPESLSADYEIVPWTPLRKIIARRLVESKRDIPHYYIEGKFCVDEIARIKEIKKKEDINLTYTDFLVFLTARALEKYPLLNGALENNEIRVYKTIDIGLAVAIKDGLVVPVVRDCRNKGIARLSKEIKFLADRARENKLSENELKTARFVISNLGMYGVENFQPIINPPGVAIMGVGSICKEPYVVSDRIAIRSVMNVSFSFDHRVIDGSYAGNFYSYFKSIFENPSLLVF